MTSHPSLDSTPPSEPFRQWEDDILNEHENVDVILDTAYRAGFNAGADQELEACCEWLETGPYGFSIEATAPSMTKRLRAARRPKPPTLKEQALEVVDALDGFKGVDIIRRALESLPD